MSVDWISEPGAFLRAGGHLLEYACFGPPPEESPTIVLLHEGLGSLGLWRDFPERLAAATGYGVLAYSRAGYGSSDPVKLPRPLDYMTSEATGALADLIDAAGLRRVILMGHSDGATIAAIYAGSVSDLRVRALILIAPHFFAEPQGIESIRATGEAYAQGTLKSRLARHHAHVDIAFRGWYDTWTDPRFAEWNVADCIDHWRIPVLALQGSEDPYGSLAQITEISDRIYSPLEIEIFDGCGHFPHSEEPQKTLAVLSAFTARLKRLEDEEVRVG